MAAEHSFDVVSNVDLQEVRNAVQQALKEIQTRFDFKASNTDIRLLDAALELVSSDEFKLKSAFEVLQQKLVKRGVSLKALRPGKLEQALGGAARQRIELQLGIPVEGCREIVSIVKGTKLKVQATIQGDQVRITGKSKDDLQLVVHRLRESSLEFDLQFTNYR